LIVITIIILNLLDQRQPLRSCLAGPSAARESSQDPRTLSTVSTQSHPRSGSPIQSLQKVGTTTCQELDAGQTGRENRLYEGEAGPEAS